MSTKTEGIMTFWVSTLHAANFGSCVEFNWQLKEKSLHTNISLDDKGLILSLQAGIETGKTINNRCDHCGKCHIRKTN